MSYVRGQTGLVIRGYSRGTGGMMAWLMDTVARRKSKQTLFYMSELYTIT